MVLVAAIAMSCVGTRHLKEGEYLLYNQKFNTEHKEHKEGLRQQLAQKENRRIWILPIAPYVLIYYWGEKQHDITKLEARKQKIEDKFNSKIEATDNSAKAEKLRRSRNKKVQSLDSKIEEGNLRMSWGEPLTVLDSTKIERSIRNIEVYMKANGWFRAHAAYAVEFEGKLARVYYTMEDGPRYAFDTIVYNISDPVLKNIVMAADADRLVRSNAPYSQNVLSQERIRIDDLLKNNGYFDFSRQYISYKVDSTVGDHKVKVQLNVMNPANTSHHKHFVIDSVSFSVEGTTGNLRKTFEPFVYKDVTYQYANRYYSEKVLNRRIHIRPGSPYSRENTLNTQRELAGMDMYKFVNINYDTTAGHFLANIFVSPLDRYQWTVEAGLTVTRALPGPFASISLKQRNILNTFGNLEISGNLGVEGVAAASNPDDVLASIEAGGQVSLTFPRFFLPLTDEAKQKLGFYNPKTIVIGRINFTDRPEYTRSQLTAANSYTWQPKQSQLYDFQFLEVGLVRTNNLDSAYHERLKELELNGNNLINSFRPSFISSQRLTVSINKNNYGWGYNNSSYFSIMAEPGGTFTNLWARDFFASDSLEIYAYVKLDTDFRKIFNATKNQALAFRIRGGVAYAYGENGLLPYEKYFFSGGSISNRAWKPRRLGPGSYNHIEENGQVSYRFEQQGEIILESSLEFRQKLLGFLHWAAFVDAGNIWTIQEDNSRPGSGFNISDFYKEIAVGAGLGLRLDFSYFILRFDASAKIVDPARPLGSRFILSSGFYDPPFNIRGNTEPIVYTLSIGYPF